MLARELAEGPQVAMRPLKRSVSNAARLTLEQTLDESAVLAALSDHHPDARAGIASFRDKRATLQPLDRRAADFSNG